MISREQVQAFEEAQAQARRFAARHELPSRLLDTRPLSQTALAPFETIRQQQAALASAIRRSVSQDLAEAQRRLTTVGEELRVAMQAAVEASARAPVLDLSMFCRAGNEGIGVTTIDEVQRQLRKQTEVVWAQLRGDAPIERFLRESNMPPLKEWLTVTLRPPNITDSLREVLAALPPLPTLQFHAPGELTSDLLDALDGDEEARARLAEHIMRGWKSFLNADDAAIHVVLRTRAQSERTTLQEILRCEVLAALILILPTSTHPQPIRLGNRHIRGDDGQMIAPLELESTDYWRWLRSRVIAESRRSLLDFISYLPPRAVMRPDVLSMRLAAPDNPLEVLITSETLAETWACATPAERKILEHIRAGYELDEAAKRMGKAYSTIRNQIHRLRKRAESRPRDE